MNKALQLLHGVRQQLEQRLDLEKSHDSVKDGVSTVVWDDSEVRCVESCQKTTAGVKSILIKGTLLVQVINIKLK